MSEFIGSHESKLPPKALLYKTAVESYDRLADELRANSDNVRKGYEAAGTPNKFDAYLANLKRRFIHIKASTDNNYVEVTRQQEYGAELPEPSPYKPLHLFRGVIEVESAFTIFNASETIEPQGLGSEMKAPTNNDDFIGIGISAASGGRFRSSIFEEKDGPRHHSGTIYTSPEFPPFFVPKGDEVALATSVFGTEIEQQYSMPAYYLEYMHSEGLPIQELSDEECVGLTELLQESHACGEPFMVRLF